MVIRRCGKGAPKLLQRIQWKIEEHRQRGEGDVKLDVTL
jgi:hypothetical protein